MREPTINRLGTKMMNKVTKPTTRDALQSIWSDYNYLSNDQWILSQDIQNEQPIEYLEALEQFVESVAKSPELPFVFDKNFAGTTLKTPNNLGKQFYDLLGWHNKNVVNPDEFKPYPEFQNTFRIRNNYSVRNHYEVSENMEIFYAVASDLDLYRAHFQGKPMSQLFNNGTVVLLEGELINSFVTHLRETTKRKSFKTKVEDRKKKSSQSFNQTKRYVDRLYTNTPSFFGMRMVMCYQSQYANTITLADSDSHLKKLFDAFETESTLGSPVGYWWKREYMTETSYRYYLIVFFNVNYDLTQIHDNYSGNWSSITRNQGRCFIPVVPDRDYQRCNAIVPPQGGYIDNLNSLLSSIQRMFMRDLFLRLEYNQRFDHFGMGQLPKLTNTVLPSNITIPDPISFL